MATGRFGKRRGEIMQGDGKWSRKMISSRKGKKTAKIGLIR